MPYRLAYADSVFFDVWSIIDILIDSIFFLDIIINFFSSYITEEGETIADLKTIAKNYLKSWFFLDLVACIPFNLIDYAFEED